MDDYEKIQETSIKLAKENLINIVSIVGYISSSEKGTIYTQLVNFHRNNMINGGIDCQSYSDIIIKSTELSKLDLNSLINVVGYVQSKTKANKFLESLINHTKKMVFGKPIASKNVESVKRKTIQRTTFISIKKTESFYERLVKEINDTYTHELCTATMILSRKLIENLLIDILRKKYAPTSKDNVEIYYSTKNSRFHDFTILLRNLEDRKKDFEVDAELIDELLKLVSPFKDIANKNTHALIYFIDNKNELGKYNIQRIIDLMERLYETI